ncbi:MAG: hypothetical protein EOO11_03475 [Chitinophagaceae bacterium]|nr:MAG: hypothetical protein EOO11_03475 [Chitinophagaceae bacterium]
MRIDYVKIQNFRGFNDVEFTLDARFNLFIGDNGSGKTSILEALTVSMGSLFLGLKNTDSRNIRETDIRLSSKEGNQEYQYPVIIESRGVVNGKQLTWIRSLMSAEGNTLLNKPYQIKKVAEELDQMIREGVEVTMPILAYYPTGRLWKDLTERNSTNDEKKIIASRLRAYKGCLQATSTFKIFLKWFKGKEQSAIQKKEEDIALKVIRKLIVDNLPNCQHVYYEFDIDKIQGLKVVQSHGVILPFEYLSDGTRNLFALLADIAYKCLILNPHLKEVAVSNTPGIVLIDELDLHLHPDWQKSIVQSLKSSFPSIQFIVTSHSPFIIQEMAEGQLFSLKDDEVFVSGADQLSIEDIAEQKQDFNNPQWSEKRKQLFVAAKKYFEALEKGEDDEDLEQTLTELIRPFSPNPAFDALIEQEKLTKQKKQDDETGN